MRLAKQKELILSQETFEELGYFPENLSFGSNKKIIHKCDVCGGEKMSVYQDFMKGIGWAHNKCKANKARQTCRKKYGVDCVAQVEQFKEKSKRTCMEKYGVESTNILSEKKEKIRRANLERYGFENQSQRQEVKEKKKQTCLKHFGTEHPSQCKEVAKKKEQTRRQTWLRKKGIDIPIENVDAAMLRYLQQGFEQEGYKLLSAKYINLLSKLDVECPRGDRYKVSWSDWKYCNARCPICGEHKREKQLGEMLEQIFPGRVVHSDHPDFLQGLELDFLIEGEKLVFEHDGQQHFFPVRFGGITQEQAEENFREVKRRDRRKNRLCKKNGYRLIRIRYDEELTLESIKVKIGEKKNGRNKRNSRR